MSSLSGTPAALDWDQESSLLQALQQRGGDAAPVRELGQGEGLGRGGPRHRRDQRFVRGLELAGQESLDHGQGETALLEVPNTAQPLEVPISVPGDTPIPARGFQQAFALVEPDGVDGHARSARQLFDPILHEYLL